MPPNGGASRQQRGRPGSGQQQQQRPGSGKPGGAAAAAPHVPPIAADCSAELEQLRRPGSKFKCSIRFRNDLPEVRPRAVVVVL
jgi:hypothetical protein